jgi:hypothetical protein
MKARFFFDFLFQFFENFKFNQSVLDEPTKPNWIGFCENRPSVFQAFGTSIVLGLLTHSGQHSVEAGNRV